MQTVRPSSKQLFCKPAEAEMTTKSGFILSEKSAERPKVAEVINIGAEVRHFKSKDSIIYKSYSTTDIKLDGQDYFLVAEDDVLGTVISTK